MVKKMAVQRTRRIVSAAAVLGGKMSKATIRLAITNVLMDGDYTGTIYVGSQKKPVNVIFDTGSSTLAIDGTVYDATKDATATSRTSRRKSAMRTAAVGWAPW